MLYLAKPRKLQQHDITPAQLCHGLGLGLAKELLPRALRGTEQGRTALPNRGAAPGRNTALPAGAREQAGLSALPSHGEQNADQPLSISMSKSLN